MRGGGRRIQEIFFHLLDLSFFNVVESAGHTQATLLFSVVIFTTDLFLILLVVLWMFELHGLLVTG